MLQHLPKTVFTSLVAGQSIDYSPTNAGRISNIAKYKNDQWSEIGNLNTARHGHSVITSGSLTFIIGGCECIKPGDP